MRRVIILGSTGSIGTQALEVIRENRDLFEVVALAAGTNAELLEAQANEFGVPANRAVWVRSPQPNWLSRQMPMSW